LAPRGEVKNGPQAALELRATLQLSFLRTGLKNGENAIKKKKKEKNARTVKTPSKRKRKKKTRKRLKVKRLGGNTPCV
jgi:hypothetical protein